MPRWINIAATIVGAGTGLLAGSFFGFWGVLWGVIVGGVLGVATPIIIEMIG